MGSFPWGLPGLPPDVELSPGAAYGPWKPMI